MDVLLEIVVELILMKVGFGVLALFVSSRLMRLQIPFLRLFAIAGILLFGAVIGDLLGSALFDRGIVRQFVEEAIQAGVLAAAVVKATHASVAKASVVAVMTGLVRQLLLYITELLWALYVFGSARA
jgi:uncharacterized membrane protein YdbT with pleckstrin-like domain